MLAIIVILACGYGALMLQDDVTANTRENLGKTMFGEPLYDCMQNSLSMESIADENDPKLLNLSRKLTIYNVLFFIVQLGILYLGSALIVRKFNKKLQNIQDGKTPEFLN